MKATLLLVSASMFNGLVAGAAYSKNKFFPKINDIVSFGDSYTDESRLGYFIGSKGVPPPVGWVAPPSNTTASGGKSWPRIVSDSTGIELHNYAVSGAVCSNRLTPKYCDGCLPSDIPFPSVTEYEVPAFIADLKHNARKPLLSLKNTIFTIWIGTSKWLGFWTSGTLDSLLICNLQQTISAMAPSLLTTSSTALLFRTLPTVP